MALPPFVRNNILNRKITITLQRSDEIIREVKLDIVFD